MDTRTQMLLTVYWGKDGVPDRHIRYGETTMHVGDVIYPPLTSKEMQDIAFAAKMAFAKVCRDRKGRKSK